MFWGVALHHLVTGCLCCEGEYCIHYQSLNGLWRLPLKQWEPPRPTTQYYIPEDRNPEAVIYSLKTFSD